MTIKFPRPQINHAPMPPAAIEQMLARAPAGHPDLAAALKDLGSAYTRTLDATKRYMADAMITEPARMVKSAKGARATLEPALAKLKAAKLTALAGRANLQSRASKPFDYAGDWTPTLMATEIRAHFLALPTDARLKAVRAAIEGGDAVTLKALGAAPVYLTGLPPAMHTMARDTLISMHPDASVAASALKEFDEQDELATKVEALVLQGVANSIDFMQADSFAAAAAEVAAA